LLKTLPDTSERARDELSFYTTLGPALMAAKGQGAPEVEQAYTRARELCYQVGDTAQVFSVLYGLWLCSIVQGAHTRAYDLAEQFYQQAQQAQESALLLEAHRMLAAALFWLGELRLAHWHAEQGSALYDPQQHRAHAFRYGFDPGVACFFYAAHALWFQGYADQAFTWRNKALTLAHGLSHPISLAWTLSHAAFFHQFRREAQPAQEHGRAAVTLSIEQDFPVWLAIGAIVHGWAVAVQGHGDTGITEIRENIAAYQATGAELLCSAFLAMLAEAYREADHIDAALNVLTKALTLVDKNSERFWEAELRRLKGELLLRLSADHHTEAESCFHQALAVARHQQAKSLELRATMSLSRLWQQQGKRAEAHELLAPIYGWFTEGFDTADLQEAKALLDALA
jgi:predicted ATPase